MADNRNFVNKFANQGGGDIFVEDAKLSEISTKTAIASEGVMLKGTDGAYYEIDKASLSEVIRAELGAILADNSKNNGTSVAKVPTLNSSGNALGASSVADLASVLGVKNGGTPISPSAISNGNAMKITLGSARIAIITFLWSGTPQTIFIFSGGGKVYGEGYSISSQIVFKKVNGATWEIAHASGSALDGFQYFPMFGTLSATEVQKTGDYSAVSLL